MFDYGGPEKEEERRRRENARLKGLIGELTIELKESEDEWL
ncbi:MAG TPA: hypothetical protein PLU30_19300 [Verrucomicrobiae bacterium]|nr:hypothetical protein [Verrucomicrobiae bacterium]